MQINQPRRNNQPFGIEFLNIFGRFGGGVCADGGDFAI